MRTVRQRTVYPTGGVVRRIPAQQIRKLRIWAAFFVVLTFGIVLSYHIYLARTVLFSRIWQDADVTSLMETERRAVLPHMKWVDDTDRWREAYPAELQVYTAFYYYKEAVSSSRADQDTPPIIVLGLMTSTSCSVEARVVYKDYPNSFRVTSGTCRYLAQRGQHPLKAVALEFKSRQPGARVPVSISVLLNGRDSQVWIPVRATVLPRSAVEPRRTVGVCCRTGPSPNVALLAEFIAFHRLLGASRFTLYTGAGVPAELAQSATLLPWENAVVDVMTPPAYAIFLQDCILRSRSQVEHVVTLDVDEFFVPRHYDSISAALMLLPEAEAYTMEIATFCDSSSERTLNKTMLVTQRSFQRADVSSWQPTVFRCLGDRWRQATVPQSEGTVQRYRDSSECLQGHGREDKTAIRFGESLRKAKEVQKYVFSNG
ncbi:uncharacterized protein LOC135366154 isoform X2 [Ornithodoros turicata]|uniref:uncharacterized protein LOC135366154 isoform X2 n=1 Tax=Ornithodoros turicata TaxID=34597 RepID=UPI003139DEE0